jgi:hypothetical protein
MMTFLHVLNGGDPYFYVDVAIVTISMVLAVLAP